MKFSKKSFYGPKCYSCGYERVSKDVGVRHRCPSCGEAYLFSREKAEREELFENYEPNHIPLKERVFNCIFGFAAFFYSFYGLVNQKIHIPGKRTDGVTFTGDGVIWGFLCLIFISISLLSIVVDHYDRRDNEVYYSIVSKSGLVLGIVCLIVGMVQESA